MLRAVVLIAVAVTSSAEFVYVRVQPGDTAVGCMPAAFSGDRSGKLFRNRVTLHCNALPFLALL